MNRQNSVSYNGTQVYSFQYDANNNLTKETDETTGTSTNYSYDADNRLTSVQEPNSNQTDYTYDANGNVTQQKLTAGSTVITQGFAYNSNNQLTKITSNGANQAWFNYNEQDQVARRKTADGNMTFNRYNGAGDLVERDIFDKNGNLLYSYLYVYDNKGRITSVTETDGTNPPKTTSYEYDALDQLTKETRPDGTVIEYTYDETGNRLTKKVTQGGNSTTTTYTYDDADQLTSVNGTNYTYDANGNLTSDGNKTYVYDAANRLTAVKDSSGNTIASFTYRADGMRKTMTTASGTITFHYDQNKNVSYETDQSGAVVASYTYDDDNLPVSMTRGGKTYFYQLNDRGDVVALTDSTGAVVNTYTYDAFGNLVSQTGTVVNPYTYAGYRYDKETGLYYLQSRYYNPDTGRFLTRDTDTGEETNPITSNKYIYTNNSPIQNIDPNGQRPVNITKSFINMCKSHARYIHNFAVHHAIYYTYKKFYKLVKNKGPWDLKQKMRSSYILLGKVVSGADLGNIHYGYVALAAGIPSTIALLGAGYAQVRAGTSSWSFWRSYFDDPRDQRMIRWGFSLYHKYGR